MQRRSSKTSADLQFLESMVGATDTVSRDQRALWADEVLAPVVRYHDQAQISRAIWERKRHQSVKGPRRCGKSSLFRVFLAMLLQHDGFTLRIMTGVLHAPTANFLARPKDGGMLRILRDLGLWTPGKQRSETIAEVNRAGRSIVEIRFPWGSGLYVHDIADAGKVDKHHGFTGDYFWFDEASKLPPGMLSYTLRELVNPTLVDTAARILLTYTPDENPTSVTTQRSQGGDPEWDHTNMASWRNVAFGDSFEERWGAVVNRSIAASRTDYSITDADLAQMRSLSEAECDGIAAGTECDEHRMWVDGDSTPKNPGLDPALLRNIFGRQVIALQSYVYDWHRLPAEQLYWCAVDEEHSNDGQIRIAATLEDRVEWLLEHPDLQSPDPEIVMNWRVVLGVDIGETVGAWAITVWAWSQYSETAHELYSDAEHNLGDDGMLRRMIEVADGVLATGLPISVVVADATGMRAGTRSYWDREMMRRFPKATLLDGTSRALHVVAPKKGPKPARRKRFNLDLMAGRIRVIAGSRLDLEGRHLRYHATKPGVVDVEREIPIGRGKVIVPGNHAMDTALYAGDEIGTLRSKAIAAPPEERSRITSAHKEWRDRQRGQR